MLRDMALAERILTAAPARAPIPLVKKARLAYLDSLKVLLTALVIAHHAGQAYGPTGGRWPIFDPERAAILGPFFAVNAAFFMGLFFLISGYFMPGSFDRKGGHAFLRDRAVRFGVPLIVLGLTIGALTRVGFDVGHLWFVAHLLVYAAVYAAWRGLSLPRLDVGMPGHRGILGYVLLLAGITGIVRMWFPIDRWMTVLGIVPVEVAHWPQYVSLFWLGVMAARGRWLDRLPTSTGLLWLGIGLGAAALRYAYSIVSRGGPDQTLWTIWEAVICVGLCVGLPVLFRERFTRPASAVQAAAPNAYGAYVVHVLPVVVGLQFALASVAIEPFVKFALVTVIGVPLSFVLAAGLRRLPGVRSVL
jgi:hypothetical protein